MSNANPSELPLRPWQEVDVRDTDTPAIAEFECKDDLFDQIKSLANHVEKIGYRPAATEGIYTHGQLEPPQFFPATLLNFLKENDRTIDAVDVLFAQNGVNSLAIECWCDNGSLLCMTKDNLETFTLHHVPSSLYEGHLPQPILLGDVRVQEGMRLVTDLALRRETKIRDRMNNAPFTLPDPFSNTTFELLKNSLEDRADVAQNVAYYNFTPILDDADNGPVTIDTTLTVNHTRQSYSSATQYQFKAKIIPLGGGAPVTIEADIVPGDFTGAKGFEIEIILKDQDGAFKPGNQYAPYISALITEIHQQIGRVPSNITFAD